MFSRIRSIIVMQVMIAAFGWGFLWFLSPFSENISDQIANLPAETHENLTAQLVLYKSARQLKESDEQEVLRDLGKLNESLSWKCPDSPVFYPRIGEHGIVPVDMKWKCVGNLLQLPVYIEGLSRIRSRGVLSSIQVNSTKEEMEFQMRFLRAVPEPPDWSSVKEELSQKEKAILRQGWLILYWKAFQQAQNKREEVFDKQSFMIELSRVLTEVRNIDARVEWSVETGFTKRSF